MLGVPEGKSPAELDADDISRARGEEEAPTADEGGLADRCETHRDVLARAQEPEETR